MALLWVDRYVRQWEFSCAEEGGLLILNGVGADALSRDGHGSAVPLYIDFIVFNWSGPARW